MGCARDLCHLHKGRCVLSLDLDPIRARLAHDDDFRFLARAREDIAALIEEVERLRAEMETLCLEIAPWQTLVEKLGRQNDNMLSEVARLSRDHVATWEANAALTTEVERLRGELAGFRRYLTRSIADDIAGEAEAWEILDGISNEDYALIDRWTAAMENPAYAASDAARLRKDVWDLSEANISLDRNLKDCVAWLGALESVILVDLNALRLEPDRAAAIETVRRAVEDWGTDDRSP